MGVPIYQISPLPSVPMTADDSALPSDTAPYDPFGPAISSSGIPMNTLPDTRFTLLPPESPIDATTNQPSIALPSIDTTNQPSTDTTIGEEISKGLERGKLGLSSMKEGLKTVAGKAIGSKSMVQSAIENLADIEQETKEYAAAVPSYKGVKDVRSGLLYATGGIAENILNMGVSMAGFAGGGLVARVALGGAIKKAATEAIGKSLAQKAIQRGGLAGGYASSLGLEAGSIASEQIAETGDVHPMEAVLGGSLAAVLDVVPEWYLAKRFKIFGGTGIEGNLPIRMLKGGLSQAALEAPTESMQTVIENASVPGSKKTNAQLWEDVINSGIIGGLLGFFSGGLLAPKAKAADTTDEILGDQTDVPVSNISPAGQPSITTQKPATTIMTYNDFIAKAKADKKMLESVLSQYDKSELDLMTSKVAASLLTAAINRGESFGLDADGKVPYAMYNEVKDLVAGLKGVKKSDPVYSSIKQLAAWLKENKANVGKEGAAVAVTATGDTSAQAAPLSPIEPSLSGESLVRYNELIAGLPKRETEPITDAMLEETEEESIAKPKAQSIKSEKPLADLTSIPIDEFNTYSREMETAGHPGRSVIRKRDEATGKIKRFVVTNYTSEPKEETYDEPIINKNGKPSVDKTGKTRTRKKTRTVEKVVSVMGYYLPEEVIPQTPVDKTTRKKVEDSNVKDLIEASNQGISTESDIIKTFPNVTRYITVTIRPRKRKDKRITKKEVEVKRSVKLRVPKEAEQEPIQKELTIDHLVDLHPESFNELIDAIHKKKAEGFNVDKLMSEISKEESIVEKKEGKNVVTYQRTKESFMRRILDIIDKKWERKQRSASEPKRSPELKERTLPAPKGLIDVELAKQMGARYEKSVAKMGFEPLGHRDDKGQYVVTIFDSIQEASDRAFKLNLKYDLTTDIQKKKADNRYTVQEIKLGKSKKYIILKRTMVSDVKAGKEVSYQHNIFVDQARMIFNKRAANSKRNAIKFFNNVLIPWIEGLVTSKKKTGFRMEPVGDEMLDYFGTEITRRERVYGELGALLERLKQAVRENSSWHFRDKNTGLTDSQREAYIGYGSEGVIGKQKGDIGNLWREGEYRFRLINPENDISLKDKSGNNYISIDYLMDVILPELAISSKGWELLRDFNRPKENTPEAIEEENMLAELEANRNKLSEQNKMAQIEAIIASEESKSNLYGQEGESEIEKEISKAIAKTEKYGGVAVTKEGLREKFLKEVDARKKRIDQIANSPTVIKMISAALDAGLIKKNDAAERKLAELVRQGKMTKARKKEILSQHYETLKTKVATVMAFKNYFDAYVSRLNEDRQTLTGEALENISNEISLLDTNMGLKGKNRITAEDIPRLIAIYDKTIARQFPLEKPRDIEDVYQIDISSFVDQTTAQIAELLGSVEEPGSGIGASVITKQKVKKEKEEGRKIERETSGLEKIVGVEKTKDQSQSQSQSQAQPQPNPQSKSKAAESIEDEVTRLMAGQKFKSKSAEDEVRKLLRESIAQTRRDEALKVSDKTNRDMPSDSVSESVPVEAYADETETDEAYTGDIHEMNRVALEYVSEYVDRIYRPNTFSEFIVSMREFLADLWDNFKYMMSSLWHKLQYMKSIAMGNVTTEPRFLGGRKYRIPRNIIGNPQAELAHIRDQAIKLAIDFDRAYKLSPNKVIREMADGYRRIASTNFFSESPNRHKFMAEFDELINKTWALTPERFDAIKSVAIGESAAKSGIVQKYIKDMGYATLYLRKAPSGRFTAESVANYNKAIREIIAPYMLWKPTEATPDRAIQRIMDIFRTIPRNQRHVLSMSPNWHLVRDNAKIWYVGRTVTPNLMAWFNAEISKRTGVKFNLQTAINNHDAYRGIVNVSSYLQPFNINKKSHKVLTVMVKVDKDTFIFRSINKDINNPHLVMAMSPETVLNSTNIGAFKIIDKADEVGRTISEQSLSTEPKYLMVGRNGFYHILKKMNVLDRALAKRNFKKAQTYAAKLGITRMTTATKADIEKIRMKTGWSLNIDGKWRYEISDKDMAILSTTHPYGRIGNYADISHILKYYPDMSNIRVTIRDDSMSPNIANRGLFHPPGTSNNSYPLITISSRLSSNPDEFKSTLVHELQHAIQYYENEPGGLFTTDYDLLYEKSSLIINMYKQLIASSPIGEYFNDRLQFVQDAITDKTYRKVNESKMSAIEKAVFYDLYRMQSHEAEARLSQGRINLSTEEGRNTLLKYDIPVDFALSKESFTDTPRATLKWLQDRFTGAEVKELSEPETYQITFKSGYSYILKGTDLYSIINESGDRGVGSWKITDGLGLMQIANIHERNSIIVDHEILHMVADIFLTREEQSMLVGSFMSKSANESISDIWERIANTYAIYASGRDITNMVINRNKSLFEKIKEGAKKLLYDFADFVFGIDSMKYDTPEKLFAAIRSGDITSRDAQVNLTGERGKAYIRFMKNAMPVIRVRRELGRTVRALFDPNASTKSRLMKINPDPRFQILSMLANGKYQDGIPFSPSVIKTIQAFLYKNEDARREYEHVLKPRMKLFERIFSNPIWKANAMIRNKAGEWVRKYPAWFAAIGIETDRFHNNMNKSYHYINRTETYHKLSPNSAAKLDPLFIYGTTKIHRYLTPTELIDNKLLEQIYDETGASIPFKPLTQNEITGYLEITSYLKDVVYKEILSHAENIIIKPYMNALPSDAYATLSRLYQSLIKGSEPNIDKLSSEFNKYVSIDPITGRKSYPLKNAYNNLKKHLNEIRAERSKIGFDTGYFPLRRDASSHYVAVYKIDPDTQKESLLYDYSAFGEAHAANIIKALYKKMPELKDSTKYKVIPGVSSRPNDSTFFMIGDLNTSRIINVALDKLSSKEAITEKESEELSNAIFEAVSDVMKARGAGMSSIERRLVLSDNEWKNIEGYKKTDLRDTIDSYIHGYYGMQTKYNAAMSYMEVLKNIKMDPDMYDQISTYAKNNLRNMDQWDRCIGKVKGFMFYWYLAGKLSMAFMQFTQNFITAIPLMAVKMRQMNIGGLITPEKIMIGAMRDLTATSNLSDDEIKMLEYFDQRGDTMPQYLNSVLIEGMAPANRFLSKSLEILSLPMKHTEIWNRRVALLGYYRMLRDYAKKDMNNPEVLSDAYRDAENFMYNSHWWYSRANLPETAHGGDWLSRIQNLLYTFRPFTHNYVLSLYYHFLNEGGVNGLLYAARSFAWITIIAGTAALPWIDDFIELVEQSSKIPIRIQVRQKVRELLGADASRFMGAGLAGLLYMDISAAVRPAGLPSIGDWSQSVFGVYSGAAQKGYNFFNNMAVGDLTRAIESISPVALENLLKAYRLYEKGATTTSGNPVYGPDGRQYKLTLHEALWQGSGIRSYDLSTMQQDIWEKRVVVEAYNSEKSKITKMQRLAKTREEENEVIDLITKFNLSIPPYLYGVVSPLKWQPEEKPDKTMQILWDTTNTRR